MFEIEVSLIKSEKSCRVGLVVSVSASRTVGRGFASWPGHTKDHHKNGTNCLPAWHAMNQVRSMTVQPDCLRAGVCRPCVETELMATSWNFSLCQHVKKVCVDRQLIGYS